MEENLRREAIFRVFSQNFFYHWPGHIFGNSCPIGLTFSINVGI